MARQHDDVLIQQRRHRILCEMTSRETPRLLLAFALLISVYVMAGPLTGHTHRLSTYLADLSLAIYLLSIALLIKSDFLTERRAPALFASAVVVTVVAFSFQYSLEPDVNILGVIMICLAACGPLILLWVPFGVAMIVSAATTIFTIVYFTPFHIVDWIVTVLMAVGMSTVLLWSRRSSATRLAVATVTIEEMATRDPLTGVLNRHGLDVAAMTMTALAERRSESVFAAFVDIVGLKYVNDTFGHAAGDLVIQRTSRAVESVSRGSDIVVRWGGDEFLVLGIGPQPDPRNYAMRIMKALDLTGLEGTWPGQVSVGTSSSVHGDLDSLVAAADKAMYDGRGHAHQGIAPATPTVHRREDTVTESGSAERRSSSPSGDPDHLAAGQAPGIGQEQSANVGAVQAPLGGT